MKKLAALVVLAISLFAIPAFASVVDLGKDVYDCSWLAEWKGSDVSRNGIAYEVLAIIVDVKNASPEARKYYRVGPNIATVGYLRYLDCINKRFADVRIMSWDTNGNVVYDSGIANEWTWYNIESPSTMMGKAVKMFCGGNR
jgi:hypothetical protein